MRKMTGLGILAGLALAGGSASATTTTNTFGVTLLITANCVINSTATLDLGSSGVINTNHDANAPLHIQCTNTTPYTIGLDKGTTTGATIAQRLLANGGATVNYTGTGSGAGVQALTNGQVDFAGSDVALATIFTSTLANLVWNFCNTGGSQ